MGRALADLGYDIEICSFSDECLPNNALPGDANPGNSERSSVHSEDCNVEHSGSINDEAGVYNIELDEDIMERLMSYEGREFKAIIDFNSKLPRLVLEDGSFYLDNIDGPFFDVLLDNPLYHHLSLSCPLRNYNILTIDSDHVDYVKKHYKHIKSATRITIPGTESIKSKTLPFSDRSNAVLFTGTYYDPKEYFDIIQDSDGVKGEYLRSVLGMLLDDPEETIENALKETLINDGYDEGIADEDIFAKLLNRMFIAEKCMRNHYRRLLIDTLAGSDIPVIIMGSRWFKYPGHNEKNIKIRMPEDMLTSYDVISGHRLLIDSSPFFKKGLHDRITAGMANRTIVLSDDSKYKKETLGSVISTYDLRKLKSRNGQNEIRDQIRELLNNERNYNAMTEEAHAMYEQKYTWHKLASLLSAML